MHFTVRADDEPPQLFQGTYTFHPAGVLEICSDDGQCLFVSPRWWLEIKENSPQSDPDAVCTTDSENLRRTRPRVLVPRLSRLIR